MSLVRCLRCGEVLDQKDAWRVDVTKTPSGEHWGWAHPNCAEAAVSAKEDRNA